MTTLTITQYAKSGERLGTTTHEFENTSDAIKTLAKIDKLVSKINIKFRYTIIEND